MKYGSYLVAGIATTVGLLTALLTQQHGPAAALSTTAIIMTIGFIWVTISQCLTVIVQAERTTRRRRDAYEFAVSRDQHHERESLSLSRQIHARAANTISALRTQPMSAALRRRCDEDALQLQLLTASPLDRDELTIDTLLRRASAHAARLDIDLVVESPQSVASVALAESTTVDECLTEALTNVSKHSNATTVTLTVECIDATVTFTLRDNGVGWLSSGDLSYGIDASLCLPGVEVSYANHLSGGLAVKITTQPVVSDPINEIPDLENLSVFTNSLIPVGRTIAFWLLGLNGAVFAITWRAFPAWWWLLVAITVACVVMPLVYRAASGTTLTVWSAGALVLYAGVLVMSPVAADSSSLLGALPAACVVIMTAWLFGSPSWLYPFGGFAVGLTVMTLLRLDTVDHSAATSMLLFGCLLGLSGGVLYFRRSVVAHAADLARDLEALSRSRRAAAALAGRRRAQQQLAQLLDDDIVSTLRNAAKNDQAQTTEQDAAQLSQIERRIRTLIEICCLPEPTRVFLTDVMNQTATAHGELSLSGINRDVRIPEPAAAAATEFIRSYPWRAPTNVSICYWSAGIENGILIVCAPQPAGSDSPGVEHAVREFAWTAP